MSSCWRLIFRQSGFSERRLGVNKERVNGKQSGRCALKVGTLREVEEEVRKHMLMFLFISFIKKKQGTGSDD